jgi:uncharacterized protein (DUF2237 family)
MIAPLKPNHPKNVLGNNLVPCCLENNTGWYRNGSCESDPSDHGRHVVCAVMTAEFLAFSKKMGNDLSTPVPAYNFPGLQPGDCWCLCAVREGGKRLWRQEWHPRLNLRRVSSPPSRLFP